MSQGGVRGFEDPGQQVAEQDGDSELDQTIQLLKEISNNDRKLVELVNDLIVSCMTRCEGSSRLLESSQHCWHEFKSCHHFVTLNVMARLYKVKSKI